MMSVTRARTRLAGGRFTLNSSRRVARCLHSSSQRQAEANELLEKAKSTDMRDHLDNIEQMHLNYKLHGDMDFSGGDVGELDVHLHPRWRRLPPTGIRGAWNWLRDRYHNGYKNYYAMYQLAKRNGIPDVTVSKKFPWTREAFYIFGSTLHLPMLNQCLAQYKQLQKALATGNSRAIRRLTTKRFQPTLLKTIPPQPRKDHKLRYHWRLHSVSKPLTFESIRSSPLDVVMPGLSDEAAIINALVIFDTKQSLAVYDHNGKLVTGSEEPKHVREAYTFEFRSWMPGPPRISDQVYEDGARYGLASPNVRAMVAMIPGPVRTAWGATLGNINGALDVWNTWWAWKARAKAEKRLAKSQARYDDVAPPSTPAVKTSVA